VVEVGTALTSLVSPLVPPVIVSLVVNVPTTEVKVSVNKLVVKLAGR
jgi:hypothetical protein